MRVSRDLQGERGLRVEDDVVIHLPSDDNNERCDDG